MKPLDLGTLFDTLAERGSPTAVHLDRPFDVAPDGGTTYRIPQLAHLVRDLAGGLAAAGLRPGEHVAVVKENHWDAVLLACAAVRIGAVPALLSDRLAAPTLQTMLDRLAPALLLGSSTALATLGLPGRRAAGRTIDLDGATRGTISLRELRGAPVPPVHRRDDDAPLIVNHTSGTTGVPKLVVHSTSTMIRRLAAFEASPLPVLTAARDDVVASAISYVHGRAVSWTASVLWHRPRKLLVLADHDPQHALPLLAEHGPTILECLPSTYVRWQPAATQPQGPLRDVRLFISTFDAVHPSTVRDYLGASRRRLPLWLQGWGQTETGALTLRLLTRRALKPRRRRHPTTRHLGWPVPFRTRLKVVDPADMTELPAGRPGLILAHTRARCLGYVAEQERWRDKADGPWFNTGDIGVRDRLGGIRLLDREVDIAPQMSCMEIEDVIDDRLPEVTECVVLASPGRPPAPVLVTADGALDEEVWAAAVADLPPLGPPILLADHEIPRTATGKVRRVELRARLAGLATAHGLGRWT
jgi:acyl-coenzyme A synthetase/AMP-(fatty) acid ligase